MQCVLLLAGEGKRMRPLTEDRPKPLVEVSGKPLIAHVVDALPDSVDELIMVIGYKGEMIKAYCGTEYKGRPVTYIMQTQPLGTASALWLAKPYIKDDFLVMFGDDIHGANDIARLVLATPSLLVKEHENPERFGVVSMDSSGLLASLVEKPEHPESNLVSTGPMVLGSDIFSFPLPETKNGEHYLSHVVATYALTHKMKVITQETWIPLGYPEDVTRAEAYLQAHTATRT